jgi:hypothetical protein
VGWDESDSCSHKSHLSHRAFLLAVAAAMALSIVLALAATPYGIGVTPDSLAYLRAAESVCHGTGLYVPAYDGTLVPLTHFPPLYPATIAGLASLGLEPLRAARWIALLMAAVNILAVALAAYRFTGSRAASASVGFVLALSVDMLFLNTAVWSDAEFICFAVVSLLCLTRYLEGRAYRYLVAGALAAALAWLTRYVGGALIAAGIVGLAALGPGSVRRRSVDAALFGAIASAPGVAWMLRNLSLGGSLTDRTVLATRDPVGDVTALVQTMCSWLLPGTNRIEVFPGQSWLVAVCVLAVGVATLYALVRWVTPAIDGRAALIQTPVVFLVFGLLYTGAVLVAAAYFDSVPMDNRVLAPTYVAGMLVVVWIAHVAHRHAPNRFLRFAIKAAAAGLLLLNAVVAAGAVMHFRAEGRGFVGPQWQYPLVQRTLTDAAAGGVVFSNYASAVDFRLGRRARDLSLDALSSAVARDGTATLVFFDNPRSYAPRSPGAVKTLPTTTEYRAQLLAPYETEMLAHERNAWVYRLRPRKVEGP